MLTSQARKGFSVADIRCSSEQDAQSRRSPDLASVHPLARHRRTGRLVRQAHPHLEHSRQGLPAADLQQMVARRRARKSGPSRSSVRPRDAFGPLDESVRSDSMISMSRASSRPRLRSLSPSVLSCTRCRPAFCVKYCLGISCFHLSSGKGATSTWCRRPCVSAIILPLPGSVHPSMGQTRSAFFVARSRKVTTPAPYHVSYPPLTALSNPHVAFPYRRQLDLDPHRIPCVAFCIHLLARAACNIVIIHAIHGASFSEV